MKDGLNRAAVRRLAENLAKGQAAFESAAFEAAACKGLDALELKDRVAHVARAMAQFLPDDFATAIDGIRRTIPTWDRGPQSDSLRGFASWPVFVFVQEHGLDHPALSLEALRDLTHLFTAEFALRPFLLANQALALRTVHTWTRHPSDQVRRLASEGIRPRLPWAGRLPAFQKDPSPVLSVLNELKDDESEYVRRSVGNCLADLAVDNPDHVIKICKTWIRNASPERRWVIKRGTRNLIKAGHPGVWSLHGYTEGPQIRVEGLAVQPKKVSLGEKFEIQFELRSRSKRAQRLVVDFVIHHVKASGKTSSKVFKWSELSLAPGAGVKFSKKHSFRDITTRVYYPGAHRIEVQINGARYSLATVELQM
jgi:3-methyladenine DNA glycosylase AlkC